MPEKSIEQMIMDIENLSIVIAVIAGKGGVGKSLTAQLIAAKLRITHKVLMIDTDYTNSSTATIDSDAVMVDLWDTTARGALAVALGRLQTNEYTSLVADTGAQEDKFLGEYLGWLARETAKIGSILVPVLPITLSSHNQIKACAFAASASALGLPTLFVRNLGQGRKVKDYEYWMKTQARAKALGLGVVEIDLPDLGARWTDEASGFGLSLADAAQGRFQKAGEAQDEAAAIFDPNIRSWLNIFIQEFGDAFVFGLYRAIANRRKLDRA